MRFQCQFRNDQNGEVQSPVVELSVDEIKSVDKAGVERGDGEALLLAQALALRAAYRQIGAGFQHVSAPDVVLPS